MNNQFSSLMRKIDFLTNNQRVNIIAFAILTTIMTISLLVYQNAYSFEMYLNNQKIAVVDEKNTAVEAISAVENQVIHEFGNEATFEYEISLQKVIAEKDQIIDQEQLQNLMYSKLDVYKPAAVIMVDGEESLILETKEQAEMILETVKAPFIEKIENEEGNAEVLDISFSQQVEIIEKDVLIDKIFSEENALNRVRVNHEKVHTYKIASGDSAWNVSRAFNTSLDTLEVANPDKDIKDLMPGEVINLVVEEPFIDVITTIKKSVKEEIKYETVKEKTSSLYTGQSKVKQQGKNGEKEVTREITYINGNIEKQKVLGEKIISEPTKKVLLTGTKSRPASSSSGRAAPTYNGDLGSSIVATAKHYIGTPYRSGGSTPAGFDCSGFTSYVYKQYGISIPRTSGGQGSAGGYVAKGNLRPGDIVAFSGHVGIYVGNNKFIHSPRPGKSVQISSLSESYWRSTYRSGRRVY